MKFRDFIFTIIGAFVAMFLIRLGFKIIFVAYGVYLIAKTTKAITLYLHRRYVKKHLRKGCAEYE